MDFLRNYFNSFYSTIKKPIFYLTEKDPEVAHKLFVLFSKILSLTSLEKLVLDNRLRVR